MKVYILNYIMNKILEKSLIITACETGDLNMFINIYNKGSEITPNNLDLSASFGHLKLLTWAFTYTNIRCSQYGMIQAIINNHIETVRYFHYMGIKTTAICPVDIAIFYQQYHMIKLLYELGYTHSMKGINRAHFKYNLEIIELMLLNNYIPNQELILNAFNNNQYKLLQLYCRYGYRLDENLLDDIQKLEYLTSVNIAINN
jgi:hypothetical protein